MYLSFSSLKPIRCTPFGSSVVWIYFFTRETSLAEENLNPYDTYILHAYTYPQTPFFFFRVVVLISFSISDGGNDAAGSAQDDRPTVLQRGVFAVVPVVRGSVGGHGAAQASVSADCRGVFCRIVRSGWELEVHACSERYGGR